MSQTGSFLLLSLDYSLCLGSGGGRVFRPFSSSLKLLVPKKEKSRKEGEVHLHTTRGSLS